MWPAGVSPCSVMFSDCDEVYSLCHLLKYVFFVSVQLILPFQEDSAVLVEENTDIPDYLPEEESPSQEQDKAVTRVGSITDGMGWLSTAANFLSRSFYWWPLPVFISLLPIYPESTISCSLSISQPLSPILVYCPLCKAHRAQQVLDCQADPAISLLRVYNGATNLTTGCMCTIF